MIDDLYATGVRIVEVVVLFLIPAIVAYGGERLIRAGDVIGYHEVPGLARLSALSGILTGLLVMYVNLDARLWEFDIWFARGGPWDVPFQALFTHWLNPWNYVYAPLAGLLAVPAADDPAFLTAFFACALAGLAMVGAIRYFGLAAPLAWVGNVLVWGWGVAITVYVVCAGSWALCMMNFWALVLWFLAYRHWGLRKEH